MKRLFCDNIDNMRDLGGYATIDGGITKYNVFIRSDFPTNISEKEKDILINNGFTTIIDLRTKEELARNKHPLNDKKFNYFNVNLNGGKAPEKEENIPFGYMDILSDYDSIKKIFSIILSAPQSVLFNCTAGKDRTGIIAMLLLLIANVRNDDIIVDYQISYTYLRNKIRKIHEKNPDLPAFLGGSKLEYMEKTLSLFYKKYVSISNYFEKIGLSKLYLDKIKDRFVLYED